jgi:RND superfamily putative drug exporter
VSPTNGSVVFAEGIAGSSVSTRRASKVRESVFRGSLVLVSTGRALIRRASITGASIIGASITGASITGASITGASITGASIIGTLIGRASNRARKRSNSSLLVDGGRYSSFSYFLSSFRWYYPSRLKSLAIK